MRINPNHRKVVKVNIDVTPFVIPSTESKWRIKLSDWIVIGLGIITAILAGITLYVTWKIGASDENQRTEISELKIIATNDTSTIRQIKSLVDSQTSIIKSLTDIERSDQEQLLAIGDEIKLLQGLNKSAHDQYTVSYTAQSLLQKQADEQASVDKKNLTASLNFLTAATRKMKGTFDSLFQDSIAYTTGKGHYIIDNYLSQFRLFLENVNANKMLYTKPYISTNIDHFISFIDDIATILSWSDEYIATTIDNVPSVFNIWNSDGAIDDSYHSQMFINALSEILTDIKNNPRKHLNKRYFPKH